MVVPSNTNLLQPSGFRLVIDRQNYANLEYFVQSVDHPGVNAVPAQLSYSRVADVSEPGDKLDFGEVTFGVILDEDMKAYSELYAWLLRMVNTNYVPPTVARENRLSTKHDVTLVVLNSSNNVQSRIVYRDAFPSSMGNVSFEASVPDQTPIVVPVTFRYTYFDLT